MPYSTSFLKPSKAEGVVAKYTTPSFFAFHKFNSFETGCSDTTIDLLWILDTRWIERTKFLYMREALERPNDTSIVDILATFTYSHTRKFQYRAPENQ